MSQRANEIRAYILKHVEEYPHDIVTRTSDYFHVTRTTIHRHINTLVNKGQLIKSGITANIRYHKSDAMARSYIYTIDNQLNESGVYYRDFEHLFSHFNTNIQDICHYGFTEMFNNAIDHAKGHKIVVSTSLDNDQLTITIEDDGVGLFYKITEFLNLSDMRESVLQLSKGKLTTDAANHTGEGLFFTARVFDVFQIFANGIHFYRNNHEHDWGIEYIDKMSRGTKICLTINIHSDRQLVPIFKQYQNIETLAFDRTEIIVELSRLGHETLISRSQAKRILFGLERFNHVTLDFAGVRLIGQGFVDEIFRVFKNAHPQLQIVTINTNSDVEFMIRRSRE